MSAKPEGLLDDQTDGIMVSKALCKRKNRTADRMLNEKTLERKLETTTSKKQAVAFHSNPTHFEKRKTPYDLSRPQNPRTRETSKLKEERESSPMLKDAFRKTKYSAQATSELTSDTGRLPPLQVKQSRSSRKNKDVVSTDSELKKKTLSLLYASPRKRLAAIQSTSKIDEIDQYVQQFQQHHMRDLISSMIQYQTEEAHLRLESKTFIRQGISTLPLKFLSTLPGGASYCRIRLQQMFILWISLFERSQKRVYLHHWRDITATITRLERQRSDHARAVSIFLHFTCKTISQRFQAQALKIWIHFTRWMIWNDRHNASVIISRLWRGYNSRKRVLFLHQSLQWRQVHFQNIYLAPMRPLIRFRLVTGLRDQERRIWSAAVLIQQKIRFKRLQTFVRTRKMAIITIQAQIRTFAEQKRYCKLIRAITQSQSIYRMRRDRRDYFILRKSASILQRSFRCYQARRLDHVVAHLKILNIEKEWTGSILLQRFARGFLARRKRFRLQEDHKTKFIAALRIQRCWYRHNGEFSTFVLLCCLREEGLREIATRNTIQKLVHWKCATRLQSSYRKYRERVLHDAIVRVQCFIRQWLARKIIVRKRREIASHRRIKFFFRVHNKNRHNKASKLQFFWLYTTKRLGNHLHDRRIRSERQNRCLLMMQEYKSATRIQARVRGFLGRKLVARLRALEKLKRFMSDFFAWKAYRRQSIHWKTTFAAAFATSSIEIGLNLACEARMESNSRFAVRIQQFYRGFKARQKLIIAASSHRRQDFLARSIQSSWRHVRQRRLVTRVAAIRRRQQSNPASNLDAVSDILSWTAESISALYNPEDDLCGMSAVEWLYRIGIPKQVTFMIAKSSHFNSIAGNDFLITFRQLGVVECERIFKNILQIEAKFLHPNQRREIVDGILASLFGYAVKQNAAIERRKLKGENQIRSVLQYRYYGIRDKRQKVEVRYNEIQCRLNAFAQDTKVFRRLPNALKKDQTILTKEFNQLNAQRTQTIQKQSDLESAISRQEIVIKDQQKVVSKLQKKEVNASYDLDCFQLLGTTSLFAQKLFLDRFPRLQKHASTFSKSLHGIQVTKWQFQRFFECCDSILRVPSLMALLTDLHSDETVRDHNRKRFLKVSENLQCGVEKICELLGLPLLFIVTAASSRPFIPRPEFLLDRFLLLVLQEAYYARQLSDSMKIWFHGFQALTKLNNSVEKIQAYWRGKRTRRRILQEERYDQQQRWLARYLEERNRNHVVLHWQQERDKEQTLAEMQKCRVQRATMEAYRSSITRFPYFEKWDEQDRLVVFIHSKDKKDLLSERPTYTESEEYMVLRVQKAYRAYAARKKYEWQRRRLERQKEKHALKLQWIQIRGTQRGPVNCTIHAAPFVEALAAIWWAERSEGIHLTNTKLLNIQKLFKALQHAYDHTVRNNFFTPLTFHICSVRSLISSYEVFRRSMISSSISVQIECTLPALRYGWTAVVHGRKQWFYQLYTHKYSAYRPEYDFDEEYAATQLQTLGRRFIARLEHLRLISSVSIVDCMHVAIAKGEAIGWIGFGYEGMKVSVFLDRLALPSHRDTMRSSKLYAKDVLHFTEKEWSTLLGNLQKQELAILYQRPSIKAKRNRFPLTRFGCWSILPSAQHPFNFISSDRILHNLLAKAYPNQQSRAVSLRTAIKEYTPVTYGQLESHVQRYGARPDEALMNLSSISDWSATTNDGQEKLIFYVFLRAVLKCIVYCAILKFSRLRGELSIAVAVVQYALGIDDSQDQGIPYAVIDTDQVAAYYQAYISQFAKRAVRGYWERPPSVTVPRLTYAQAALYLRSEAIERALVWVRSVIVVQSLTRMRFQREIYRLTQADRSSSALTIQSNWKKYAAKGIHSMLLEQLRSDYEQCFAVKTKQFFYIYRPSMERMEEEPRDAQGQLIPYRPMVQDKLTREWQQAWPDIEREHEQASREIQLSTLCSNCHSNRAVWRCDECFLPSGDYLHFCIACFIECHNVAVHPERSGHSYTMIENLTPLPLVCVECGRFSTMRCLTCQEHYCRRCFDRIHRGGSTRKQHLCEFYQENARVCDECQTLIATSVCSTCNGVLCEECMRLTGHRQGRKAHHHTEVVQQRLEPGEKACDQCFSRRGEVTCSYCKRLLCHVCNQGSHAYVCGESAYNRLKAEFDRESMCVECGELADRRCIKCGDQYCSIRRIGQLDCFENFHQKGNRLRHLCKPVETPSFSDRLRDWKEKRAEAVGVAHTKAFEHLSAIQSDSNTHNHKKTSLKSRKNTSEMDPMLWTHCRASNCGALVANAKVLYCLKHLTPQVALEMTNKDPKAAAKLLLDLDKRGKK
uniref:Uncharacterized protein AlNc14C218G9056 n=1 Tax=Albugo laibachii Nc14 TaxID=890382 RepID=F0WRR0_9STRA|nr:conserved hypothetical protein [Albugo laibachii Nc14]|eukprot:CCA24025.1 conserved hypothetical protein [Albugo laibachii Nc14]